MRGTLDRNGGAGSTLNTGFLVASTDDSSVIDTTTNFQYAGHVFGIWGQGLETMPKSTATVETAFSYASPTANAHGLMVSIFPYDGTSAGLASGKTNVIKF